MTFPSESIATLSTMRSLDSTVGETVRPMPKGLNSMLVLPRPCATGTGISPPARKLALCPDSATSVGSAISSVASSGIARKKPPAGGFLARGTEPRVPGDHSLEISSGSGLALPSFLGKG